MTPAQEAFALVARTACLKARCDVLSIYDRLLLAEAALEWVHYDAAARGAVLSFLRDAAYEPTLAAMDLFAFLEEGCGMSDAQAPFEIMRKLHAEAQAMGIAGQVDHG